MMPTNRRQAGARMSYWIAAALHDAREQRGVELGDAARALRVSERTLRRLEIGGTMGRDIDQFVAGYAYLLGIEDGRELWKEALTQWSQHGAPPQFMPVEGPAAAFAEAIRAVSLRRQRDADAPSGKQTETPNRRAVR